MSTTTTNYDLVKPDLTDTADITVINGDLDVIDATLKTIADGVADTVGLTKPNLTPYFDHNTDFAGTQYVSGFSAVTKTATEYIAAEVGDVGVATINVGAGNTFTATAYPSRRVKEGTAYTVMLELWGAPASGLMVTPSKSDSASQFGAVSEAVADNGVHRYPVSTRSSISSSTKGLVFQARNTGSSSVTFKARVSLYEGTYTGSFKPYSYGMSEIGALIVQLIEDHDA